MDEARRPGIAAEDIGRCAFGSFVRGRSPAVKSIGVAGEHLNGAEMAARISRGGRSAPWDSSMF